MSKKKGKNSNYKNNIGEAVVETKPKMSEEMIMHLVVWITATVIVLGILIGAILSTVPKITYVEMEFEGFGKIVLQIDGDAAPITAKNFVKLVKSGFYDGLTIFRAQKNFVIQGGKDESANLPTIKGEFESNGVVNSISHKRGVISMARISNEPDSATSEFFITLSDGAAASLDGEYAGFGYVVEGMEVVDALADNLFDQAIDSMGFVADKDSVKITYAKVIKYNK